MKMKLSYQIGAEWWIAGLTLQSCVLWELHPSKIYGDFRVGQTSQKRVRFFPGNGDGFSFNGGWLEGSFTLELACGGFQALLGIETRSFSL